MEKEIVSLSILFLNFRFFPMFYMGMHYFCVSEHSCGCFIILVLTLVNGYVSLCSSRSVCQINETVEVLKEKGKNVNTV